MVQYADDTQLLVSGKKKSLPELIATMEQTLSSLDVWFHSHGLKVNTGKTEFIVWFPSELSRYGPGNREDIVRESPAVRNLGVFFDKNLSWDSHVSALVKKCNGILIGLSHVRHSIPTSLLPIIVDALVLSQVRYCLAVFENSSENNMQRLQKVLNFGLRAVSGRRKCDHISDVERNWAGSPPVSCKNFSNFSTCFTKFTEPENRRLLLANSQVRSRSTRQDADLALPRVAAGKGRVLYAVVQQYNGLPRDLREASLQSFKRELREILCEV